LVLIFEIQTLGENECSADSVFDFDCKPPNQHFYKFSESLMLPVVTNSLLKVTFSVVSIAVRIISKFKAFMDYFM